MKFKILISLLAALGVLALGGCGEKKQPMTAYDLTAQANQKFLSENMLKHGVIRRPSGLQYRIIKSGSGEPVRSGDDLVSVLYRGSLINGRVFDQTPPGQTATFPAGRLIAGWVEALSLMKEGDEWELVIPSELGYGERGAGGDIPPNQTLVFTLTLVSVQHM